MEIIREIVESYLRLLKYEIDPHTVLVASDDAFEVPKVPSLIVQGPTLVEHAERRTMAHWVTKDRESATYTSGRYPRLYHLDFEVIATAGHEGELLDLQTTITRFYQRHPVLEVPDRCFLNLTELVPVGGGRRVNLSNLRQASGRCRLEDCPIGDGMLTSGPLILTPIFDFLYTRPGGDR
ncbi:MAG: hypothetical protein ACYDBB_08635 [Armatimonadota bacterium]